METMLPNGAKSKSMRYEATSGSTSFKMNWNFIMTDAHGESSYNTAIYTDNFYIIIIHWKNQLYQLIDMNSLDVKGGVPVWNIEVQDH